jgi:hypothetical protein
MNPRWRITRDEDFWADLVKLPVHNCVRHMYREGYRNQNRDVGSSRWRLHFISGSLLARRVGGDGDLYVGALLARPSAKLKPER